MHEANTHVDERRSCFMRNRKLSTTTGRRTGSGIRKAVAAAVAAVLIGGFVALALSGGTQGATETSAHCEPRVIAVDLSSAARGPELASLGRQIIDQASVSAVVCDEPLSVYGISGGGKVTSILTSDDLSNFTPIGPDAEVRSERFGGSQEAALGNLITRRLVTAYREGDPTTTSIGALYMVAAQQSTPGTEDVFVTTGVNNDSQVNLNQPLKIGQGAELAGRIQVPHVRAQEIVEVGVAQVDSSTPPPSTQWPGEVLAFNQTLCRRSGVRICRMFSLTSATQALSS
jgi:hypothetical protein